MSNIAIIELYESYRNYYSQFTKCPDRDGIRDHRGFYKTGALFIETVTHETLVGLDYAVPYTLKRTDFRKYNRIYKSIFTIYMESVDEYDFAMRAFGSYAQLEMLLKKKWFMEGDQSEFPGIAQWRIEKEARDRCLLSMKIQALGETGNLQALKVIEDRFKEKEASRRGRPSKQQIDAEIKKDQAVAEALKTMKENLAKDRIDAEKSDKVIKFKRSA